VDRPDRGSARDGLAVDEPGPGVAERTRALAGIVVPGYLVRVLGPRPVAEPQQLAWGDAALAIHRYRSRWGVDDREHALGSGTDVAQLDPRKLSDRLRTEHMIDDARRRLGRQRITERERPTLTIDRG
jgi:hypothetical protein